MERSRRTCALAVVTLLATFVTTRAQAQFDIQSVSRGTRAIVSATGAFPGTGPLQQENNSATGHWSSDLTSPLFSNSARATQSSSIGASSMSAIGVSSLTFGGGPSMTDWDWQAGSTA